MGSAAASPAGWWPARRTSTCTAIARGEKAGLTRAVEDLTGHPATSLAQLLAR